MRGVMPAQLAAAMIGCFVLTQWERRNRLYVTVPLWRYSVVLSAVTLSAELYSRFSER